MNCIIVLVFSMLFVVSLDAANECDKNTPCPDEVLYSCVRKERMNTCVPKAGEGQLCGKRVLASGAAKVYKMYPPCQPSLQCNDMNRCEAL